jgi:hypothetical protein
VHAAPLCLVLQVERVRVNKAKARSMNSRVEALMRFLAVSLCLQLFCSLGLVGKVHSEQRVYKAVPDNVQRGPAAHSHELVSTIASCIMHGLFGPKHTDGATTLHHAQGLNTGLPAAHGCCPD